MKKDKHTENEINDISPFLNEHLKKSKGGFKMPEGYLDALTDRVMENVKESDAKVLGLDSQTTIPSVNKRNPRRWLAVAASVMLLVVAGFWLLNFNSASESLAEAERLSGFSEQEVLSYLDQMEDIELSDLVESGIINELDVDFNDVSQLTDEDEDLYINTILEDDLNG